MGHFSLRFLLGSHPPLPLYPSKLRANLPETKQKMIEQSSLLSQDQGQYDQNSYDWQNIKN